MVFFLSRADHCGITVVDLGAGPGETRQCKKTAEMVGKITKEEPKQGPSVTMPCGLSLCPRCLDLQDSPGARSTTSQSRRMGRPRPRRCADIALPQSLWLCQTVNILTSDTLGFIFCYF